MNSSTTLDDFVRRSELLQLLDDTQNSNLYILYINHRNKKVNSSEDNKFYVDNLIKITKINVISKYEYGWLRNKNVDWVQLGPVLEEQYHALNMLQSQGFIKIEKINSDGMFSYRFVITEEGVKLIEEKLRIVEINTNLSVKVPFEDEIINLLRLENEELVNIATECFGNANHFKITNIGEFKIIQIFNWTEFGDGNWKKCYDTLLWALQSMDESGRFSKRDASLFAFSYQNIDEIQYFKSRNGETLRSVFQKSLPPSLSENKIEAKNYIINIWYILEAINIFHAIIGICPSVDDIARMCLLTYKLEAAKSDRRKDFDKLRRLRESTLRKDIDKLVDSGLLKIVAKDRKKYLYRISALTFVNDDEKFKLCDPNLIRKNYMLRKPKELLHIIS